VDSPFAIHCGRFWRRCLEPDVGLPVAAMSRRLRGI
jgi:hypothetical protein